MTSRLLRSRPTTAWRTTRPATATSLAVLALTAATAAGQHRPAQTTWQPYPVVPVGTTLPSAAAPPVSTTPPPARLVSPPSQPAVGPIGSRVVVYTKPAGEVRPVQAVGGGQQPGTGAEPPLTPEQRVDRARRVARHGANVPQAQVVGF